MKKHSCLTIFVLLLLSSWIVSVAYTAELKIEKTLTQTDGLASDTVLTVFEDSHGTMWFGTTDGVTRYDGENFQTFTIEEGLASNTIGLIFEDQQGMLWFATSFGVSQYDGESFNNITMNGPMGMNILPESWNQITAIAQDTAGNFWFGSTAGITYFNLKTSGFRHFGVDSDFAPFQEMGEAWTAHITDLQFDAKENLWMSQDGTDEENSGVCRFDGKKLTIFPQSAELPMNGVNNIMQDSSGNLWFTGVKKLPPKIHETEDNVGMIFPEVQAGVSVYNGKTFRNFNTADGLPSNRVWSVYEDSSGWWYTLNALHFINPQKGWIVGDLGTVLHTTDGGETWIQQAPRYFHEMIKGIFFLNETEG